MNLFNKVKNSLYNPAFYNGIKEERLSRSFKYFFGLIAILSVVIAFALGVQLSTAFSVENLRQLANFYPKELSIQIKGGVISTNVAEPYLIKGTADDAAFAQDNSQNLVVIDTKNDFSVEQFQKYDTKVLIGKNFVVTTKRTGQFEFNDVSKMPDFSLSQARILHWIDLVGKYHWAISLLVFICVFVSYFWFFSFSLLGLLIIALIVKLLAKLKKIQISYRNAYQVSIYAFGIPLILEAIFILGGWRAPLPFFFSLIAIIIALSNLKK